MVELSEKDFDRIERFILGTLSVDERQKFEKELESNPDLQKALYQQKQLINAVEAEGLKADLDSIHHELYESTVNKNNRPLYFSIAASIAVLIGFSFWYFGQNDSQSELYAQYSYTDPGLPVPMSATDSYDFYDAMVDYKTEDYQAAINKWEILLKAEPQNDTLNYYIGASYFNMESLDQAKPFLQTVSDNTTSSFRFKAEYTLLLSLLKEGKTKEVLDFNVKDGSPFQAEIEAIQESLDS